MNYHLGLVRGERRVIVQARRCVDFLDCETWIYIGVRDTTKKHLYEVRRELLTAINGQYGTTFDRITID